MRGRHALIPVLAVALFGWAVALNAWPLVLLGAVIGGVLGYTVSGEVHRGLAAQATAERERDWQQIQSDWEQEREQMIAINRDVWDEKLRAERRAGFLDVELRQAQEALAQEQASTERRVQNAAGKAARLARKAARDKAASDD